jgi:hypothetical protein
MFAVGNKDWSFGEPEMLEVKKRLICEGLAEDILSVT